MENGRLAWDVLTISRSLRRLFLSKKTKWTIGLRRPHNFAAGFALKFVKKWKIFCIFFVENGRLAWDVLTISRPGRVIFLLKKWKRKLIRFFLNGRLAWDVLTFSRSRWRFVCQKMSKNGRFAWDVLAILLTNTVVLSIVTFQKRTFALRRVHIFALKFAKKLEKFCFFVVENGRLAWDVLTISRSLRRFFFFQKTRMNDWPETSSQFRCRFRAQICETFFFVENWRLAWDVLTISRSVGRLFFQEKYIYKTKMDDWPETSWQFRGRVGSFFWNNWQETDQIFQERAFGVRRPHNFAISLAFFVTKKCQKQTFRLRRPRNFADQHGLIIDRYISKTDLWLETCSHFRAQICEKMINSLYLFSGKRAFGVRRPHNFAFSVFFFFFF